MPVTVDLEAAKTLLEKAWGEIQRPTRPPPRMQILIENVLSASDITFKYILVTGFLAKCVNPKAHARAIQASSSLKGAYDARSLCHKVVIGFEKSKGNLFGLSNEPFVNKPARHPEHDGDNTQLRNKPLAKLLHEALEQAQSNKSDKVHQGLVHILRIGFEHAANTKEIEVTTRANTKTVLDFIHEFLKETDGGARLVGIWGAFAALLSEEGEVKVYSPNAPDLFGKTAGDVEIYYNDILVSAAECKQRPLSLDDLNHGIKKSLEKGIAEYVFVVSSGVKAGQDDAIAAAVEQHSNQLDLSLINIWKDAPLLAGMLNPLRRAVFGVAVVKLLRDMRKFDSANVAAELWNAIKG